MSSSGARLALWGFAPAGLLLTFLLGCANKAADLEIVASLPGGAVCSGCLCLRPDWSCDADTWLAADGTATELKPEAGYFEIEAHCFGYKGEERCVEPARMWYAFQPADEAPEHKPLAVFFNGHPVHAESAKLFVYNTASRTLDPKAVGAAPYADNPHSWTRFANVLYPDPRHAGFSYALGGTLPPGSLPSAEVIMEQDLSDVVRLLVRFLERHPLLRAAPIVVVAESFAGTRANWLFDMLLHYDRLRRPESRFTDAALFEELQRHFEAVVPAAAGRVLTAPEVAQQFGHQVLIQPLVAGQRQFDAADGLQPWPDCSPDYARCQEVLTQGCEAATEVVDGLVEPSVLSAVTMVDAMSVAWLAPAARRDAVRLEEGTGCADWSLQAMEEALGPLDPEDSYYLANAELSMVDIDDLWLPDSGYRFLSNVRFVRTFITHAGMDPSVWSPAIPLALATFGDAVSLVTHDQGPEPGIARPGRMRIEYRPEWAGTEETVREVRMPIYERSGHMVPAWQPAEILEDVQSWYEGTVP